MTVFLKLYSGDAGIQISECFWSDVFTVSQFYIAKGKGKGRPRRSHEGPDEVCMYSCTLSLTSALDGGACLTSRPARFTPGNDPVPIVQEAGPVWMGAENLASTGNRSNDHPARS